MSTGRTGTRLGHALVDLVQARMPSASPESVAELARICQTAFSHPVAVSVTVGEPAAPTLVAAGSKLAQNLDGAQLVAGEGPCQLSWERRAPVHTSDLRNDPRWPRLASQLDGSPVCAVISVPLKGPDGPAGTLNVYSGYAAMVDESAVESAELLGTAVGEVLMRARHRLGLENATMHLETALISRATIDQAKGIIMARHGCDAEEAFRILAEASSSANVKLREVAERLVREATDPRARS
jgi:GAF domain-containing protein